MRAFLVIAAISCVLAKPALCGEADGTQKIRVLYLGAKPEFALAGVELKAAADLQALSDEALQNVDVIAVGAVTGELSDTQETTLLNAIGNGKGFVGVHGASSCFSKSSKYAAMLGARFNRKNDAAFKAKIIDAQHGAMLGLKGFDVTDVAVVHKDIAKNNRVLMARDEAGAYEPLTWIREHGKGRVFYTALGGTEKTWAQPEFKKLLENGIRWAAGKIDPGSEADLAQGENQVVPASGTTPPPLSPQESMKHMHLPEGFRVELFASEPDIVKPVAMSFDERGRLWVLESLDYPNEVDGMNKGNDRIKICEDTDGDGKADKFTIYAQGFNIPTGIAFGPNGAVIACAPDIISIPDANHNDKPDQKKTLFTGFGKRDTHAVLSNLRYGPDNWIWGTVGYSGGEVLGQKFAQGVFRFKPEGGAFEFLTSTSNNTWGLGFNEMGDAFMSTANNQHAVHMAIPNRYFESVRGWSGKGSIGIDDHKPFHPITKNVRQGDVFGGYTAAAGMTVYTARSFPQEYWNRAAFVCEPTGHLIHTDWLVPRGSGYIARDGYNLMASSDPWTAPIETQVGPDGALWFIDWYNYIIIHNNPHVKAPHGKGNAVLTPLRDQKHGRVYRIVHESAKPVVKPQLDKATPDELIAALSHENMWWRLTAQRLLIARKDKEVVAKLKIEAVKENSIAAIHARAVIEALENAALDADVAKVIANCSDNEPKARLANLLKLSELPPYKEAGKALVSVLTDPKNINDQWIPLAAISAAARNDLGFLEAAAAAHPTKDNAFRLREAVRVVAEHYARGIPKESVATVVHALLHADPAILEQAITGLERGWPAGHLPAGQAQLEIDLPQLAEKLNINTQPLLVKLAQRWQIRGKLGEMARASAQALLTKAADLDVSDGERILAARQAIAIGADDEAVSSLLGLINAKASPAFSKGILDELGASSNESVAPSVIKLWPTLTPNARRSGINSLMRREAWTLQLLAAIEDGRINQSDLGPDQVQQLLSHPNKDVSERAKVVLKNAGRMPDADRQKVVEKLLPLAERHGDVAKGQRVFQANCAKCHRLGDEGAHIGPELTGIAVRDKAGILIDILDPNRSVEGNYQQYSVKTVDGRVFSGLLKNETKTSIELMDSDAKPHVIMRDNIEKLIGSPLSLMPEGFENLPEDDLVSLLEFLTAKGQFVPVPLNKVATQISTKRMFSGTDDVERIVFPSWGLQQAFGVPFLVNDPKDNTVRNAIVLHSPKSAICEQMPKSVTLPCNLAATGIHLLSGISGWGFPFGEKGGVCVIVKINYADNTSEEHPLVNGVHFSDYIKENDVPESKLAFTLGGRQMRYLIIRPKRAGVVIKDIEFVKGPDESAPVIMGVTIEREMPKQ